MAGENIAASKKKLHYRKKGRGEVKQCKLCGHWRMMEIRGIGGDVLKTDSRCEPIGMGASIKYAIREGYVCDRFAYYPKQEAK